MLKVVLGGQGANVSSLNKHIPSRMEELFMAQAVFDQEQYDEFCREVLLRQSQPWNCGLTGGALTICGAN